MPAKKGSRADAVKGLKRSLSSGGPQTFSAASANSLHRFVCGAVRTGALVSFSRTQDGGAVVLTILDAELPAGKYKDYFADDQDIFDIIEQFAGIYGEDV